MRKLRRLYQNASQPSRSSLVVVACSLFILGALAFTLPGKLNHNAHAYSCPCSIWSDSTTPTTPAANDPQAIELGVRFVSDVDGNVTGVRFYKGTGNTGTHIGNLWTIDGQKLAAVTFSGESSTGWQTASFSNPVHITANTPYIVSYYAPNGDYAADGGYFANAGVDNAPLHALGHGYDGLFLYGSDAFPTNTFNSANYYVDVVFQPDTPTPPTPTAPPNSPGNPILVITDVNSNFTKYYAEILHGEGLNDFASGDISTITSQILSNYKVVVLGQTSLTNAQVTMLSDWVNAGGNLIAMRPDSKLASLLGLTSAASTLSDKYLLADTSSGPGKGIVNQTIQYHGSADLYTLNGATAIATLYSDATTATSNPAVTMKTVGNGHAAAFTYDLATSVIDTRQGNPAFAGQDRDGVTPIRADDMFFPSYVDLSKVQIPQADEQQRLLANMVTELNLSNGPMPRFWYLPNGLKAALIYGQDNHNNVGTATSTAFDALLAASPSGCNVSEWQCYRGTAYVFVGVPLTNSQAATYVSDGFELGVHINNGCVNFTNFADVEPFYLAQINNFKAAYPSVPTIHTNRFHCIIWSDWLTQGKAELANGMHLSLDYYYYPGTWTLNRAGLFTGSGIPMKYADTDGTPIDVYQVVTDFPNDNTSLSHPADIDTVLTNATGSNGYYGVFATHDDYTGGATYLNGVITEAQKFNIPIVSSLQVLNWSQGRDSSTFTNVSWANDNTLGFDVTAGSGTSDMLRAMLPVDSDSGTLQSITEGGATVSFTTQTIQGLDYAFFPASTGSYVATYSGGTPPGNGNNGGGNGGSSGGSGGSGGSTSSSPSTSTQSQTTNPTTGSIKELNITNQEVTPAPAPSPTPSTEKPSSYTLTVKVVANHNQPVVGASVTLHSNPQQATTDGTGTAHFTQVAPGKHTIFIAYQGYTGSETVDLNQSTENVTIKTTIKLVNHSFWSTTRGRLAIAGAIILALVVGLIIGFLLRKHRKKQVPAPAGTDIVRPFRSL